MIKFASRTLTSFDQPVALGKFQEVCKKFIDCNWLPVINLGPNAYRVPHMIGPSVQSNKRQAPSFSIKSRDKRGAMGEDLQHVSLCDLCSIMNGLTLLQPYINANTAVDSLRSLPWTCWNILCFAQERWSKTMIILLILTLVIFIGHC